MAVRLQLVRNLDVLLVFGVALWLIYAAIRVDLEYFDGFDTICNARYFLGQHHENYLVNRAPLMALLLIPAEWIKHVLHLHPLTVVPHHVTMACLHIFYLVSIYWFLITAFGRSWPVIAAFAGAVLNFIFFSYAPFISHDIFPGLVFLGMLVQMDRYLETGRWRIWWSLALLGAVGPLIKQTYALLWVIGLLAYGIVVFVRPDPSAPHCRRRFWHVVGAAVMSGVICWISLGLVLTGVYPETPLLLRPYVQTMYLWQEHLQGFFPEWVYLRNVWAYGMLTIVGIVPGLWMAVRGVRRQQALALAWVLTVVLMQALPMKEVRYLAFLAPVSACVIIPPLRYLRQYRFALLLVLTLLGIDLIDIVPEIARVATPFYTQSPLKAFLQPIEKGADASLPILFGRQYLSFPAPGPSPLAGDRYHRIFHFAIRHLRMLYSERPQKIIAFQMTSFEDLNQIRVAEALLISANAMVIQSSAWEPEPALNILNLQQMVTKYARLDFSKRADGSFAAATGETLTLHARSGPGESGLVMEGAFLPTLLQNCLGIDVYLPQERLRFPVTPLNPQQTTIQDSNAAAQLQAAAILSIRTLTLKSLWKNNRLFSGI